MNAKPWTTLEITVRISARTHADDLRIAHRIMQAIESGRSGLLKADVSKVTIVAGAE